MYGSETKAETLYTCQLYITHCLHHLLEEVEELGGEFMVTVPYYAATFPQKREN
jgi:hypothetical protein